jgi:hypothetical protein
VKRVLCALALVVSCLGGVAATTAPPASAESRHCVSKGEFKRVHEGMRKGRVHRVFGTRGRRVAYAAANRYSAEIRRYRGCKRRSRVSVAYGNRRLQSKSASWRRRR